MPREANSLAVKIAPIHENGRQPNLVQVHNNFQKADILANFADIYPIIDSSAPPYPFISPVRLA
jgi:hypothetical protein